ncbi:mhck ef2 kinase domain [Brachionus plicatilis]|uniref:Mhck ef2 kinase domain n=1 Tax=Brachionus plicatilis TaxID=10195 RepID=A0A3M7PXT9_BRAPC|nr:mhck ef2 kinase domain [Brachionus plicatilis]
MPTIKIFASDFKNSITVTANNLKQIKSLAETKLGYFVFKIVRKKDRAEVDDDDDKKKGIKVSTNQGTGTKIINATNMKLLKRQAEELFGVKIDHFVRKRDNSVVNKDEVFTEPINLDHNWLVAVLSTEKRENKPKMSTDSSDFSNLKTIELKDKMNEVEKELEKAKEKNFEKKKMLSKLNSMSSSLVDEKEKIEKLNKKIKEKMFTDETTRIASKVAFVGYRDHSDGANRVTVFPFTENINNFKSFACSVKASGGADECEDIFGGLEYHCPVFLSSPFSVVFEVAILAFFFIL